MRMLLMCLIIFIAIPALATPLPSATLVDDQSLLLTYTGAWAFTSSATAYGGGYVSTSDATATLRYETSATGFSVYTITGEMGGVLSICIDAVCTTHSTSGTGERIEISLTGLNSSLKNVVLSGTSITLDAIYLHPTAGAESTQEPDTSLISSSFQYDGQTYTGMLENRVTAGDVSLLIMLALIAFVSLCNLIVMVLKR